jgi:hypothetical protein
VSSQARISQSALDKVAAVGPDELVRFTLMLNEIVLTHEEVQALRRLGLADCMHTSRIAAVTLPGRYLLEVAELPSVGRVS